MPQPLTRDSRRLPGTPAPARAARPLCMEILEGRRLLSAAHFAAAAIAEDAGRVVGFSVEIGGATPVHLAGSSVFDQPHVRLGYDVGEMTRFAEGDLRPTEWVGSKREFGIEGVGPPATFGFDARDHGGLSPVDSFSNGPRILRVLSVGLTMDESLPGPGGPDGVALAVLAGGGGRGVASDGPVSPGDGSDGVIALNVSCDGVGSAGSVRYALARVDTPVDRAAVDGPPGYDPSPGRFDHGARPAGPASERKTPAPRPMTGPPPTPRRGRPGRPRIRSPPRAVGTTRPRPRSSRGPARASKTSRESSRPPAARHRLRRPMPSSTKGRKPRRRRGTAGPPTGGLGRPTRPRRPQDSSRHWRRRRAQARGRLCSPRAPWPRQIAVAAGDHGLTARLVTVVDAIGAGLAGFENDLPRELADLATAPAGQATLLGLGPWA